MAIDDNTSYELTGAQVKDLASKINAKADTSSLANVATTGDYADLTNKPTIPAAQVNSDWDAVSGVSQILNKPSLAAVATSGNYNDLINQPTIPTVNDATLTIQQNGTTVGTFTANQSTNTTINLTGGGSSYTAGNGIDITNNVISADTNVLATTKLAKDLVGGGGRADNTIFMCRIDSDDATEIAAQMGGGSAGTIEMYMKYGFRLSGTGQWLDNETLGGLLDANTPIVYKKTANAYDMNYEQDLTVIGFDAGYDQSEDNYFPTIRLMSHQWNTSNLGAFNILEVTLKSPEQSGIWYEVDETTMDTITTPYCIIKPSTSAFLQELADEYNETYADPEDPASYINALNVKDTVPFMFINQSGSVLKTVRSIGQAIKDTRIVTFNASPSSMSQNSVNVISNHSGGNTYGSFGLLDLAAGDNKRYNVRAGSSADTYFWAQHMPYVVMRDDANYDTQMPYGYTDDTEAAGAISDAPEAKYQVSKDANGNLYMASGTSAASDWKQISNVSVPTVNDGTLTIQHNGSNVQTFTANQSGNATANIQTIYSVDVSSTQPIDWTTILNKFHPVGSIYMSATLSTAAQVEAAIGGTWVAWGAGRVPVGVDTSDSDFDTAEETGGEKTHTLTTTEMPSHNHKDLNWTADSYHTSIDAGVGNGVRLSMAGNAIAYTEGNFRTGYTGGGAAHNNVQPYITCYMYKRTA